MPLSLLYPVLAQIALTLLVYGGLSVTRQRALRAREVRLGEIALDKTGWDERSRKWSNNLDNQFQTPVLFYVICGVASYIGAVGAIMSVLAWAYVITRVIHVYIHTGSNNLRRRFSVFLVGFLILLAMFIGVLVHLVF
ncbi:MAG: MAPEG family protein [Rhodobiaceae bacterium]|nr:MAPEG family protein [Rhodobiaceae bacterium]